MGKRAQRKQFVKDLLVARDIDGLRSWARREKNPDKVLQQMLFDPDPLIRWRAIEGIGHVAALLAESDMEKVRILVRGLFWLMNDESGGLVWNAPETIGLVLIMLPQLVAEYGRILASFTVEEPFEQGAYWALSKLAPDHPAVFQDAYESIAEGLENDDPYIRAYAAVAVAGIRPDAESKTLIEPLLGDETELSIYDLQTGGFSTTTVGRHVAMALGML